MFGALDLNWKSLEDSLRRAFCRSIEELDTLVFVQFGTSSFGVDCETSWLTCILFVQDRDDNTIDVDRLGCWNLRRRRRIVGIDRPGSNRRHWNRR